MADESTIQDYSFIDDYLNRSLDNYSKQLFGDYDDKTGYFEELNSDDEEQRDEALQDEQDDKQEDYPSDEEMYNEVFSDIDNGGGSGGGLMRGVRRGSSSASGFGTYGSYEEGKQALVNQLKLYQTGRTRNNVHPSSTLLEAMSVYAPSADNNDPASYANFIAKRLGVSVDTPISQIDTNAWADAIEKMEGNKVGNNPGNLRRQAGGVARTKKQQYVGLNDESLDELMMPLSGTNTIRGLDSGEPVFVQDEYGNKNVLYGPNHTTKMKGRIYEKRF